VQQWEKAVSLYERRQFKEAAKIFASLMEHNPGDKVAELYARRCAAFLKNPPPENWDAVNNLTEK
jgi:adenylate cyclase